MWIPSLEYPRVHGAPIQAHSAAGFRDCHSLVMYLYKNIRAAITLLLRWRGPSAILRRVRTVVVNAIQRCPMWSRSHVCEELYERISPGVTDRNSSAPVAGVRLIGRIRTATFHGPPREVFGGLATWLRRAVSPFGITVKASAASGVPSSQVYSKHFPNRAAHALNSPLRAAFAVFGASAFQNDQSANATSGHVNKRRHTPRIA